MALARDDSAASPLVVLTTFVIVAVLITVAVYALAFDRPEAGVALVAVHEDGGLAFDVMKTAGGLTWGEVDVQFLDRAGTDLADSYLVLPPGAIDPEDRIVVTPLPPAGAYLLLVFKDGTELSRLAVNA